MNEPFTDDAQRAILAPITFSPVYIEKVWGGRRIAQYRTDIPEGPIGESWDIADHPNGMSVVDVGPFAGRTLRELTKQFGARLVGAGFSGGDFPLLVKLLHANTRLSVQVHPDDTLAREMEVAERGKTECWLMLGDEGELYVGVKDGVDQDTFREALEGGEVERVLNRFMTSAGDFIFLDARTVHALGNNCLLYEVQQTCDITFRVWDWGRVGLDGNPRPLHIEESLKSIDFNRTDVGPIQPEWRPHPQAGEYRTLADCRYFTVEERRGELAVGGDSAACSIVVALDGTGELHTRGGAVSLTPTRSVLVSAEAGEWHVRSHGGPLRLLIARPHFD
jgi:mannose-6-phosphate isomerase